ncbi:MAG: hypothetical protein OXC29_23135 [Rhodococcus sp.]|nr:hypothetical protein [Rhodococcus sp. (in: high G+C Gram-positive bacteria)]
MADLTPTNVKLTREEGGTLSGASYLLGQFDLAGHGTFLFVLGRVIAGTWPTWDAQIAIADGTYHWVSTDISMADAEHALKSYVQGKGWPSQTARFGWRIPHWPYPEPTPVDPHTGDDPDHADHSHDKVPPHVPDEGDSSFDDGGRDLPPIGPPDIGGGELSGKF